MVYFKIEHEESKESDWEGVSDLQSLNSNSEVDVKSNLSDDEDKKVKLALDSKISSEKEEVVKPAAPARLISRIKGAHHPWGWHHRTAMESEAKAQLVPTMLADPEVGDRKVVVDNFLANARPAVLRMIAEGDEKTITESEVAIKQSERLVTLKEFVDKELAILVKEEEVSAGKEEQRLHDQKAAEDMAARIMGAFITVPTVVLLLAQARHIGASEWEVIRSILEEDERSHADLEHLNDLFEIRMRQKGRERSCA